MATSRVSFYLDESLSPEIAAQLSMQGIDIIRGQLRADDSVHLERATAMGRVLCAEDDDFLSLAAPGVEHAGIIKGVQHKHSVGDWVKYLRLVHDVCDADELRNEVYFLFLVD